MIMAFHAVKVQLGDSLQRLALGENAFSFSYLVGRTRELFQVRADSQLLLTYVDADGDVVTMGEDQDLRDALLFQALNPLRVNVTILSSKAASDVTMDDKCTAGVKQGPLMTNEEIVSNPRLNPFMAPKTDVHYGIMCADCGVKDIKGPRYKHLKVDDYSLGGKCFAKPGIDPSGFMII